MRWEDGTVNLLGSAEWQVLSSVPGEIGAPTGLPERADVRWLPAQVPGTAAEAFSAIHGPRALDEDYDALDWWFRCSLPVGHDVRCILQIGGLATLADVWLNDDLVLHSENMFLAHDVPVDLRPRGGWLTIRCASPTSWLQKRRPRPRWKCRDLTHPGYRWLRTSLIGRTTGGVPAPAPVGPWRPISLHHAGSAHVIERSIQVDTDLQQQRGTVTVTALVGGDRADAGSWRLSVGDDTSSARAEVHDGGTRVHATVNVEDVKLWWPATHGEQPLYPVALHSDASSIPLGSVGFRTVSVDRSDGAFTLAVNDVPFFARGATWTPPHPAAPHTSREELETRLHQWRAANLNIVRVAGIGTYESSDFADLCDRLGILVWQDGMFAFYDIPQDPLYREEVRAEIRQMLLGWQGRPSLAVVCGASENEQQAEYLGLDPSHWRTAVTEEDFPTLVDEIVPGTVYARTTPDGSPLPSQVDCGPTHYFGVGGYLRPLEDARRARVRFASECLPFATPPEPTDEPARAQILAGMGHSPPWKRAIHRDSGTAWDLEDVRNWYTSALFGTDIDEVRRYDPTRALDLARATSAAVFEATLAEWRRPGSTCRGAIVFQGHDSIFGAGLGLVDADGRPKATWWVMRRLMQPVVVVLTDEGVNGLGLHVSNDGRTTFTGEVSLALVADGQHIVETATAPVSAPAGEGVTIDTGLLFGGFRDLSWAHRFGPPAFDVVAATLTGDDGTVVSQAHFIPQPVKARTPERDVGIRCSIRQGTDRWSLTLTTERFAQWVAIEAEGWDVEDSWFHLLPGEARELTMTPLAEISQSAPRATVRAFNGRVHARATEVT